MAHARIALDWVRDPVLLDDYVARSVEALRHLRALRRRVETCEQGVRVYLRPGETAAGLREDLRELARLEHLLKELQPESD